MDASCVAAILESVVLRAGAQYGLRGDSKDVARRGAERDSQVMSASTSAEANPSSASLVVCPHCGQKNRVPAAASGTPRCGNCRSALPWVVDATDADFATIADDATIPVLVDLWAPWCAPCRMVSPALEHLAIELAGNVKLVRVNVDVAARTAARFDARSIPTLVVLRGGKVVAQRVGAAPEAALRTWLEDILPAPGSSSERPGA